MRQIPFQWKVIGGLILIGITGYALFTDNEAIFPTTLVLFILLLFSFGKRTEHAGGIITPELASGRAARYAINTFALFFAVMNLLVSLYFPAFCEYYNLTGLYDGDFVRVTINDMHEFCYSIMILLLFQGLYRLYFYLRHRMSSPHRIQSNEKAAN